jgi:hypothetical protein
MILIRAHQPHGEMIQEIGLQMGASIALKILTTFRILTRSFQRCQRYKRIYAAYIPIVFPYPERCVSKAIQKLTVVWHHCRASRNPVEIRGGSNGNQARSQEASLSAFPYSQALLGACWAQDIN